MDVKEMLPYLNEKLKRNVEVVPPPKKDDDKKEKEGDGGEKKEKEKDGGGEKKEKDVAAAAEVINKMEYMHQMAPPSFCYNFSHIYTLSLLVVVSPRLNPPNYTNQDTFFS